MSTASTWSPSTTFNIPVVLPGLAFFEADDFSPKWVNFVYQLKITIILYYTLYLIIYVARQLMVIVGQRSTIFGASGLLALL